MAELEELNKDKETEDVSKEVNDSNKDKNVEDNVSNEEVLKYITDKKMKKWKEEYRNIRVDFNLIKESMEENPIDTSMLETSFDLDGEMDKVK